MMTHFYHVFIFFFSFIQQFMKSIFEHIDQQNIPQCTVQTKACIVHSQKVAQIDTWGFNLSAEYYFIIE